VRLTWNPNTWRDALAEFKQFFDPLDHGWDQLLSPNSLGGTSPHQLFERAIWMREVLLCRAEGDRQRRIHPHKISNIQDK